MTFPRDEARAPISKRHFLQALAAAGIGGLVLPSFWRPGGLAALRPSDPVKLVYCLRRLPTLSRDEFQRHWLEIHAPLVREIAPALGIRRYVQSHSLDDTLSERARASRQAPGPFDGVAELWWDSYEAFAPAEAPPERMAAGLRLLEDERRFIDQGNSPVWLVGERIIFG